VETEMAQGGSSQPAAWFRYRAKSHVIVVDEMAEDMFFSEYCGFPCQYSSTMVPRYHS